MQHWRPRDSRKTVRICVRLRTDDGWIDATVRNVSNRGMLLHTPQPLRRNQFVEIARGRHRVVGRIVWSEEGASGLHAREQVDVAALLEQREAAPALQDRRERSRTAMASTARTLDERAEASRRLGRAMERGFLVVAIACVGVVTAVSVSEALAAPLAKVELALAQ